MNKRQEEESYSSEDEDSVCDSDESDEVEVDDFNASEKKIQFTINNILGLDKRETNSSPKLTEPLKPIAISPASVCGTCKQIWFLLICYE